MKKKSLVLLFLISLFVFINLQKLILKKNHLLIRSIDTVKISRDLSREKLNDDNFDNKIEQQIKNIADTGANYISIGTPYDDEFVPYLKKWVKIARKYKLKVWFRGNFSGWEGWFGYPFINKEEHIFFTSQFILKNIDLFENGDIFTSCTECENGNYFDPRKTGDIEGFRNFLIEENEISKNLFIKNGKDVHTNYFSMNKDVAKIIMDKTTTKKLGGVVVIDHYVSTPEQLQKDVVDIAELSGGKIVLGEFGAPITDIHGDMSENEQAKWIGRALELMSNTPELIGINYWTNMGASTQLWNDNGSARLTVNIIKKYFLN